AIVYPTGEIYRDKQSFTGFYTFGHIGTLIVENIKKLWIDRFIKGKERVYLLSSTTLTPLIVWKASGHLKDFWDPVVTCSKCGRNFRADHLIEEKLGISVEGKSIEELEKILRENNVRCPSCRGELEKIKKHYLMFRTRVGMDIEEKAILRPETAQTIFISYIRYRNVYGKPPFGIAQIGRSYRNEISPRRGLFRLREFEQMEIEYFVLRKANCIPQNNGGKPYCGLCKECQINNCPYFRDELKKTILRIITAENRLKNRDNIIEISAQKAVEEEIVPNEWMAYILAEETRFFIDDLGIPFQSIRFKEMLPEERPHYSASNFDLEIKFNFGWKEVVGNAYRTDYDLSRHMSESGIDFSEEYFGEKVIPHVIEPSFGIDRTFLAIMSYTYIPKKIDRKYDWLKLNRKLAPVKAVVLPLLMPREYIEREVEMARNIWRKLLDETGFFIAYDEKGSIGSRYRRYDQWGVPYSITIDVQSLEDNTVTVRDRDTRKQIRVDVEKLSEKLVRLIKGLEKFSA
ncbi:MAG TPA: glycine--tRNA ligase, partial [Thermoprotei archaeon]|nr:glycine--tRNA ligase [Thermoprotei archaeon]